MGREEDITGGDRGKDQWNIIADNGGFRNWCGSSSFIRSNQCSTLVGLRLRWSSLILSYLNRTRFNFLLDPNIVGFDRYCALVAHFFMASFLLYFLQRILQPLLLLQLPPPLELLLF